MVFSDKITIYLSILTNRIEVFEKITEKGIIIYLRNVQLFPRMIVASLGQKGAWPKGLGDKRTIQQYGTD